MDMWGSGSQIYGNYSMSSNGFDSFGAIWANLISGEGGGGGSSFNGGGDGVNSIGYGRNSSGGGGNSIAPASFGGGGSFYADSTWRSSSPDLEIPGLFNYGKGVWKCRITKCCPETKS